MDFIYYIASWFTTTTPESTPSMTPNSLAPLKDKVIELNVLDDDDSTSSSEALS